MKSYIVVEKRSRVLNLGYFVVKFRIFVLYRGEGNLVWIYLIYREIEVWVGDVKWEAIYLRFFRGISDFSLFYIVFFYDIFLCFKISF